ncbi:LOW QUALITY PROTEIN: rho GTPase-activating protein 20 [Camelus ferus]|uniref:Rho GTPase-activating protein 20 n=2 Tax=Camelus TaxID=9836 RepID=A0A8B8SEV9_CAMFR|nr:LOW QUALITY PROTEIN: rho GTPase-activating protein 20 [Camelus ferus]
MEAMSPQQETLRGQPGRSSSLTGVSLIAGGCSTKKMKTLAERRRSAPSLILDKALQKRLSTKEGPSATVDTCTFLLSMCSSRTLLIDERVDIRRGLHRQERHLFLFNDMFVVAKVKYNNNLKIKKTIKLSDMWVASHMDEVEEGSTSAMESFILGWPTINFAVSFSSPEQTGRWFYLFQRYINLEKEKDYPKSIPLKVIAKDIGNCAYSKTVTVTNTDTTNDVINAALPMLGITGSEREYRLWVYSGREEAPYQLIGHEFPYGITMSHLRDMAFLMQESKDSPTTSNLQEPFFMEQLPQEMQCHFILKPSQVAVAQQLGGQKTFKRRRSIINWAFWRGSSTHLDNQPVSPTTPMPGLLFGVSLPEICENDNLPKPILDMLFFLNKKGPLTRGIFRQSANMKSCRELREKLNSGVEVYLDYESAFVIASVLKDFLRHIPGSLLSSDLYNHWVCVMDKGSDEEKINAVQRLLDRLPGANVVLLKYLFGLLHKIEKHASSNQMNSFNLAVCIAPSILWPPASSSPELESEFTNKVSLLIQFLIENCCIIFGEEITSLLEEVSVTCDTKEKASDNSFFQLNDSSYDSLENELNEEVDAPCSDLVKKLSLGSRSMDSMLTLSDYDLEQPEVESILTLSDFDLDHPEDEDVQVEQPGEPEPVTVAAVYRKASLQDQASAPSGMSTPSHLSAAMEDAPKTPRQQRRCSEPSIGYLGSKLSFLRAFYPKRIRKSSCDAILLKKDENHLSQNPPLQEEGKTGFKTSLVTDTDVKKNATDKNDKKKSWCDSEGNHVKLFPKSKPVTISHSHLSSHDRPRNQPFTVDTAGYSPPCTAEPLKGSRRQRRCSEPSTDDRRCKLTYLRGLYSKKKQHNTSCDTSLLHREEDYLKQHKSLQMEGQKLINQSLVMGIEVGKSGAANQNTEKVFPPRLNICPRSSCSSLSSPDTSPSGSPVSSQDSAFSQISEQSVFTPTETSSPIDCTFQAQGKQEELSSDFSSSSLISGIPGPSSGQASSHQAHTKKDSLEGHSQMRSVSLHPSTWLRNGIASLKNWSLKKKARAPRPENNKTGSLKGPTEPPPRASGIPEASALQERQTDIPQRAAEGLGAVQTAQSCSSYPSQDSEKDGSSPSSLAEDGLELCMKSPEEGEKDGQCSPGTLPLEGSSPSSLPVDDVSSPDSGPAVVSDVEDTRVTKDI